MRLNDNQKWVALTQKWVDFSTLVLKNYMSTTLKDEVFLWLDGHPRAVIGDLNQVFNKSNQETIRRYFWLYNSRERRDFDFKLLLETMITQAVRDSNFRGAPLFRIYADTYVKPKEERFGTADFSAEVVKLTDKQKEIFLEMIGDGWVTLLGSRKTGKTFLLALVCLILGSKEPLEVHILSSKKGTASHVIRQISLMIDRCKGQFLVDKESTEKLEFVNGTYIMAHSNTLADTGTYESDILIIDEAQEIEEEVWSKIIPQLATGRDMKCFIFGTAKAGSSFYNFWFDTPKKFKKFELRKEDATWVDPETWKDIASLMSDRMRRQELDLEWVEPEGAYFSTERIDKAFNYTEKKRKQFGEFIVAVDWGQRHETVMMVLEYYKGRIYEVESWAKTNPSTDAITFKCKEFKRKYNPLFVFEGSPLGGYVRKDIVDLGFSVKTSNFGQYKSDFWLALQVCLDQGRLALKSKQLKQELIRYCGDKKHDDWADSLLHGVKYFYNKYVRKNGKWIFN